MKKILHVADKRGGADYGWLNTRYSFSFGEWYDPSRMGFGKLRVLNDDVIAPQGKFPMHAHANFEIITIPLAGAVTHEDSMGNKGVVHAGEVQVMSAGTGVSHSEYNASETEALSLFQIWIEPSAQGVGPRYAQAAFPFGARKNKWQTLVSEGDVPGSLAIHQEVRILRADMDQDTVLDYRLIYENSGVYVLVIEGEIEIAKTHLSKRDAIGLSDLNVCTIEALASSQVLLIEVPL